MWNTIANKYKKERDEKSNAYLILDDLVTDYYSKISNPKSTILDFGAGNGKQSFLIKDFVGKIYLYEPINEMHSLLQEKLNENKPSNFHVINKISEFDNYANFFDSINCSKVLDHIDDYEKTISFFYRILKTKGTLLLTIPHPIKYSGFWEKEGVDKYLYYKFDNYFDERKKTRSRETSDGKKFISEVTFNHRTVSTYFNSLTKLGFEVKNIYEPKPNEEKKDELPILFDQSIRVPNCMVFNCIKT